MVCGVNVRIVESGGMKMMKIKNVLGLLVVWTISLFSVNVFAASNILIEGESFVQASESVSNVKHDALSGGNAFYVNINPATGSRIPKNGIKILYRTMCDYEGVYEMYVTCPTIGAEWISPCKIKINDGDYKDIGTFNYEQVGTLNGTEGLGKDLYHTYSLGAVELRKGLNSIYLWLPEGRKSHNKELVFYLDKIEFKTMPWEPIGLSAGDALSISEEKDLVKPTILFPGADDKEHLLTYSLKDYFGETIKEESISLRNVRKYEIPLENNLKKGHYTLRVSVDNKEMEEYYFSVVVDSEKREGLNNNHFMVDSALNNFSYVTAYIPDYVNSLRLAGVTSVRERANYGSYVGDFGVNKYLRDIYNKNGIEVMPVSNATYLPAEFKKDAADKAPTDLLAVYNRIKNAKQTPGPDWNMEALNEPDSNDQGAKLAAFIKAKTIAELDSGVESKHIGPGFYAAGNLANDRVRTPEVFAQNDALDYLDTWAYHAHLTDSKTTLSIFKDKKRSLLSYYHGIADRYAPPNSKYIYNTEGGTIIPSEADQNVELQKVQARYAVTSMIDSVITGVDHHYWFVYPYYLERGSLWGSFTEDHMPHSVYNSISALTYVMADTKHVGEIDLGNVFCYVFDKGDKQLAVIYSLADTEVTIESDAQTATLVDIMGNETEIASDNGKFRITSGLDVQYLIVDTEFKNVVKNALPQKDVKPIELSETQRIILNHDFSDNIAFKQDGTGLITYEITDDNDISVSVSVTNLNDTAKSGKIVGTTFAGLEFEENEKSVTVEPFSEAEVTFVLKQTQDLVGGHKA